MINDSIIVENRLKDLFDIGTRPALIRYLAEKKIPFEQTPKGKVWTTQTAVDRHLVGAKNDDEWDIE